MKAKKSLKILIVKIYSSYLTKVDELREILNS